MVRNRLRVCREQRGTRGISKAHLARQLGVSRSYVTRLEQGKVFPSLVLALRLARYFECPVEAIFHLATEAADDTHPDVSCPYVLPIGQ